MPLLSMPAPFSLTLTHPTSSPCARPAAAEAAVMSTRGVQLSMDLFLAAPFNNALHRHVAQLVTTFECCSPAITRFLLQDCALLDWLTRAPGEVAPQPRPGDAHAAGRRPLRAGYCGHLTQIANRLVRAAGEGSNPALAEAMRAHEGWQQFLSQVGVVGLRVGGGWVGGYWGVGQAVRPHEGCQQLLSQVGR